MKNLEHFNICRSTQYMMSVVFLQITWQAQLFITYYPEEAFRWNTSKVQSFLLTNISFPRRKTIAALFISMAQSVINWPTKTTICLIFMKIGKIIQETFYPLYDVPKVALLC